MRIQPLRNRRLLVIANDDIFGGGGIGAGDSAARTAETEDCSPVTLREY